MAREMVGLPASNFLSFWLSSSCDFQEDQESHCGGGIQMDHMTIPRLCCYHRILARAARCCGDGVGGHGRWMMKIFKQAHQISFQHGHGDFSYLWNVDYARNLQ